MDKKELAGRLVAVEHQLNRIEIEGCKVGSVLSKYHENMYRGKGRRLNVLGFLWLLLKQWLRVLRLSEPDSRAINSKILLSKITDKAQCNALIDPLKEHFGSRAVLYTPGGQNEIKPYYFHRKITLVRIWKLLASVFSHMPEIKKAFCSQDLWPNRLFLIYTLVHQLNAYINWWQLFSLSSPSIIVVDFDRDNRNSPLLLAARKMGINTVTLVHGVINPPYGYWPVIADEIWCWSTYQREQLISQGVYEKRIRIVGSPIADSIIDPTLKKQKDSGKTIGIGLNPIGDKRNYQMLRQFFDAEDFGQFNWLVKLHPSMSKSQWMVELECENFSIQESREMPIKDFFNAIDLLVVGNSGIGYEAVVNSIPVWVYRIDRESLGHDKVMIEKGNCPDITDPGDLRIHLQNLVSDTGYLVSILEQEQSFVFGEFYACIGKKASDTIIRCIEEKISYAV